MNIRKAETKDTESILGLIMELAVHVDGVDLVENNAQRLNQWMFEEQVVKGLVAEIDGAIVGYCIYFYNFSSFLGKIGIFIEDICISKAFRGKGIGTAFFKRVAQIAEEKGCGRIEWECLSTNTSGKEFYKSLGAVHQAEQMIFRLDENQLKEMAK